jgi:hypothetical protein
MGRGNRTSVESIVGNRDLAVFLCGLTFCLDLTPSCLGATDGGYSQTPTHTLNPSLLRVTGWKYDPFLVAKVASVYVLLEGGPWVVGPPPLA